MIYLLQRLAQGALVLLGVTTIVFALTFLSGDPAAPYLAIDPYYMDVPDDDPQARAALDVICQAIDGHLREIVLLPGDIVLIDNFRAVHGRASFSARYDGTDRWFKRVNITRDLRKSRAHRVTCDSRVVY